MKTPPIAPWIAVSLAAAGLIGCSLAGTPKTDAIEDFVEAGLEAQLKVLSKEENLARIERITNELLKAEATRELAREVAKGAVYGLSDAAQEAALAGAAKGFVDALAAALAGEDGAGLSADLDALVRDLAAAAALGVLDDQVRERADLLAGDLSRTVAAALAEETAARLPAILDASFEQLSPRLGESLRRDVAPALASALTDELMPAVAVGLEQSLGPALERLLAERLLPVLERSASAQLPPLVRASTREAMLGLGEALEGDFGVQARAFVDSLLDDSHARLEAKLGGNGWLLPATVALLVAALLAGVYFWRRAHEQRRLREERERALFLVTGAINRLPDDVQGRVKRAVAEAGTKDGGERSGGVELRRFLERHSL